MHARIDAAFVSNNPRSRWELGREELYKGVVAMKRLVGVATFVICGPALAAAPANKIYWTQWVFERLQTIDRPGIARGIIALKHYKSVLVYYHGEVENPNELGGPGPNWTPASTFSGGTVGEHPPFGNKIVLNGGPLTKVDAFHFSRPVTNPIIAIFSLGAVSQLAELVFPKSYSLSLESGGPSTWYGGSSVVLNGTTVSGMEGNGTIQFNGTFSAINFTTPIDEYSYSITVGIPQP